MVTRVRMGFVTAEGVEEMDNQRVPNLDEMDEREARQFFSSLFNGEYVQMLDQIRHEDYVMELPQSGERVRGRENMSGYESATIEAGDQGGYFLDVREVRRAIHRDGLWVVEILWDATESGLPELGSEWMYNEVYIIELRDGKIWRETRYRAERLEAMYRFR